MFKNILLLTLAASVAACSLAGCGNNAQKTASNDSKVVICTTFAAYDWAKNIAKGAGGIDIQYLVDSKVDLHSYQPTVADIVKYQEADLTICIGGESEEWVKSVGIEDGKLLSLMDCVEAREEELAPGMQGEEDEEEAKEEGPEYDEHIWLSLKNAEACVSAIKGELCKVSPENSSVFEENAAEYISKLSALDAKYEDVVNSSLRKELLFGDRFPFRYMVDDYGLKYYAAFMGCSAETEASFETIAFLAGKVDELSLPYVCVIGPDHSIANAIIRATGSKDQGILTFDSMQSISNKEANSCSYMDIMESNLGVLKAALN